LGELTRGIIIFHNGTGIDEFEGIRGEVSVLGKRLSKSGKFGIEWWKGNLEAVCVWMRRQRDGNGIHEPFASPLDREGHVFIILAKKAAKAGVGERENDGS